MELNRFPWGQRADAQILIVDFESKSTPLIAQIAREVGVRSRIVSPEELQEVIQQYTPKLVILSGGPRSVYEESAPSVPHELIEQLRHKRVKFFGICYGAQLLVQLFGGKVQKAEFPEARRTRLSMTDSFGQYQGGLVIMNHGDEIGQLPKGWRTIGSTSQSPHAFFMNGAGDMVCTLFHPEMEGCEQLFQHLLFSIADCQSDYTSDPAKFIEQVCPFIRQVVPEGKVLVAFSGGVDSWVAYTLVKLALGDERVERLLVNNGFMVENEVEQILSTSGPSLHYVDGSGKFWGTIEALAYSETSAYYDAVRRVMGRIFIEVFEKEARRLGDIRILGQGTNRADITETHTGLTVHHNVGGLPQAMKLRVLEPLASLYKLEIRLLAEYLGLPSEIVWRQPHPGPGDAIRTYGRVTHQKAQALARANRILQEIIAKYYQNPCSRPSQYYVAFDDHLARGLVGDQGVDGRKLEVYAFDARPRESYAFADPFYLPREVLEEINWRLTHEVQLEGGIPIVRVLVNITGKPPAKIEPH